MSHKTIPFIKPNQSPGGPALDSKGPKKSSDGKIVDHGTLAELDYEIYERGVIHIFNKDLQFKKDIYIFEEEIRRIKFDQMSDGEVKEIKGSGDNDHLILTKENGDVKISLKKREFEVLNMLKSILNKGKQKLGGSK
ncbi:MAG: hypothetical protein IMZ64_06560 [Bacteroidetes bacterium]|nr:hypothetical protein [Bacteroidota bacterium]